MQNSLPPLEELVSFRCIDSFLDQQKKHRENFMRLFQKKEKLIQFVKQLKLISKTYRALLVKKYKETQNPDIKSLLEMDLMDLQDMHGGDVDEWFKDCIEQTGDFYQDQKSQYQKYLKGPTSTSNANTNKPQKPQKEEDGPFSIDEVISFRALDNRMEEFAGSDKPTFDKLFQKKEKLLAYIKDGKINATSYKAILQKKMGEIKNAQTRTLVLMDLDDLKDLHDGNVEEWFSDILSETKDIFEDQQDIYKGVKKSNKKKVSDQMDVQIPNVEGEIDFKSIISEKKAPSQIRETRSNKRESMVLRDQRFLSFKALDELMDDNKQDMGKFIKLYEQKRTMFDQIANHNLTSQIYKQKLQNAFKNTKDEDLQFKFEMEISDLEDLHDGDVEKWFEDLVNSSGDYFEQQTNIYNGYKNPLKKDKSHVVADPHSNIRASTQIRIDDRIDPTQERYSVNDIICFTVLKQLMEKYRNKDKEYYLKLEQKKDKILSYISSNSLTSKTYKALLEGKIPKIKAGYIVATMKQQLRALEEDFSDNEQAWFIYLVKQIKMPSSGKGASQKTNEISDIDLLEASPKVKVQYLLRQLARYQSVLVFFKNNQLKEEAYNFAKQYYVALKSEVMGYKEQLQKGNTEQLKNLDVVQFRNSKMKPIDFQKFHGGMSKDMYTQEIAGRMKVVNNALKQYQQYSKNLRKALNPKNKQEADKAAKRATEDLKYLQQIANKDMVPLPKIEIEKVQKFNMDEFKLQPNEMEIIVRQIDGLPGELIMRVFLMEKGEKWSGKVGNGPQNISFKAKISQPKMDEIIKGTDQKCLIFRFIQKGWFGSENLYAQGAVNPSFLKTNFMEQKVVMKDGQIMMEIICRVKKAKKPFITNIDDYKLTRFPEYKFNPSFEQEFIKKNIVYVNPTQSQIK